MATGAWVWEDDAEPDPEPEPEPLPEPEPAPMATAAMRAIDVDALDERTVVRGRVREPIPAVALEDGRLVPIDRTLVVGRNPVVSGGDLAVRVSGSTVSKMHFSVGVHEGRVWVCDLESTNGTTLESDDGASVRLKPGRKTFAPVPGAIGFGEHRATLHPDS